VKFGEWTKIADQSPLEPEGWNGKYAHTPYLCTISIGNTERKVVPLVYVSELIHGVKVTRWKYLGKLCPENPIAYMPFPEPYKDINV
jgi:hypothetical protein